MIFVGILQFAILLVTLTRGKGLALILGVEGVGVVGTIDQVVITIYQISALGLPFTAMKFMAAAHSRSQGAYLRIFAIFGRVLFCLAFVATFLAVGSFLIWPKLFGMELARYKDILPVALLGIPPLMATVFLSRTLAAAGRSRDAAIFGLFSAACLMVATLTGAAINGLVGLYMAYTVTGFGVVVISYGYLRQTSGLQIGRKKVSLQKELANGPSVLHVALSAYSILTGYTVCLLIIRYAVLQQLGETGAGFLQAALAISLSAGSVMAAMNGLYLTPLLNRDIPTTQKVAFAHEFAHRVALFFLVAAVPVALFPALTLNILYSRNFAPAATVLILSLIWQCLYQIMTVYQQLLIGLNKLRLMALLITGGFAMSAWLVFWLTSRLGLLAAPLALIAGSLFSVLSMLIYLNRAGVIRIPWPLLKSAAVACGFILGALWLFDPVTELTLGGMLQRILYATLSFAAAWPLATRKDRASLLSLVLRR